MIDFESLGYKDITEDNPIHFSEHLGIDFNYCYQYSKRYYKEDGFIKIVLTIGLDAAYIINGICYYPGGWMKFNLVELPKNVIESLNRTLILVKDKIAETIEKNFEYYGLRTKI